jgi:hypothetical protein
VTTTTFDYQLFTPYGVLSPPRLKIRKRKGKRKEKEKGSKSTNPKQ